MLFSVMGFARTVQLRYFLDSDVKMQPRMQLKRKFGTADERRFPSPGSGTQMFWISFERATGWQGSVIDLD